MSEQEWTPEPCEACDTGEECAEHSGNVWDTPRMVNPRRW